MARWRIHFNPEINVRAPEIVEYIVEIEAFKRSVLKIPLPPRLREKIDKINIIRQIKGTTGIEGNSLSEDEIESVLANSVNGNAEGISLEQREVINAERVHCFIVEHAKHNPEGIITEDFIRTIHRITTEGCNYKDNIPGEYRRHPVIAGDFHPPEHHEIPELMQKFVQLINSREALEGFRPLIRAIVAHFYLITIHPFGDGNGRTSRAIEAYILYQGGYNVRGFYSLANYFYKNRSEYIEKLQEARFKHDGNLTEFVAFALKGFKEELQSVQDEILEYVRQVMFRDLYLEMFKFREINHRGVAIVEHLTFFEPEGIPIELWRNRSHYLSRGLYEGKTVKTLQRDLQALERCGLVVIRDGKLRANLDLMNQFT